MTQPARTEFDRPSIVGSLPISIAAESAAAQLTRDPWSYGLLGTGAAGDATQQRVPRGSQGRP